MDAPSFLDNLANAWQDAPEVPASPDESASPQLSALIRVVRRVQCGQASEGELDTAVAHMRARLELASRDHDTLYGSQDLQGPIRELAERTAAAYRDFGAGLDALAAADLEAGVERCKDAADRLEACYEGFTEIQRQESMSRCLMCDQLNQANARTCARCGAVLPEQMERSAATRQEGASDLVMIPPEYVALYNACDAVAGGQMPVEEWRRHVDGLWHTFSQTRMFVEMHLARHSSDLESAAELRPVADALLEGLRTGEEALGRMLRFEEDADPEHLNDGWMDLLKGTRKIQESSAIFLTTLQALNQAAG